MTSADGSERVCSVHLPRCFVVAYSWALWQVVTPAAGGDLLLLPVHARPWAARATYSNPHSIAGTAHSNCVDARIQGLCSRTTTTFTHVCGAPCPKHRVSQPTTTSTGIQTARRAVVVIEGDGAAVRGVGGSHALLRHGVGVVQTPVQWPLQQQPVSLLLNGSPPSRKHCRRRPKLQLQSSTQLSRPSGGTSSLQQAPCVDEDSSSSSAVWHEEAVRMSVHQG